MPHKDRAARIAYYREWKKTPQAKLKNAMYDRAKNANRRAAIYGVAGRINTADVRAILAVGVCHYCERPLGENGEMYGLDHVIPMERGGANDRTNIVAACHSCNASKRRAESPIPAERRNRGKGARPAGEHRRVGEDVRVDDVPHVRQSAEQPRLSGFDPSSR